MADPINNRLEGRLGRNGERNDHRVMESGSESPQDQWINAPPFPVFRAAFLFRIRRNKIVLLYS